MHRITETCAVGIDYGVTQFEAGQLVDDDLGRRLAEMGVPVEPETAPKAAPKTEPPANPNTGGPSTAPAAKKTAAKKTATSPTA